MPNLIKNDWCREPGTVYTRAKILMHEIHPEGLDVDRIRFLETGTLCPDPRVGHIITVLQGQARLDFSSNDERPLQLVAGVYLYLPPGLETVLQGEKGTEFVRVSSPTTAQARGKRLLLRDETFVAACATESQMLRWSLTPQYLSRRIFLRHDPVLLSRSGNPVSWFRTTMFDVAGLPRNQDGDSVFKLSYNSQTEFNVCFDVKGVARVRMAKHPYQKTGQLWDPWVLLDGDSTYLLHETAGSPEEECLFDEVTHSQKTLRNKHEVYIANGYVSLLCLFDPAPAGFERHHVGEYSDYPPLPQEPEDEEHKAYLREIARFDEMVDQLSLAKARGELDKLHGTALWELYVQGRASQIAIENELARTLAAEGSGRVRVIGEWMQRPGTAS